MANHKSAEKRARQTIVKTERNKMRKSEAKTFVKKLRTAIEEKNKEQAKTLLVKVQSVLGKLASAGIIKRNNAARKTARLSSQVHGL